MRLFLRYVSHQFNCNFITDRIAGRYTFSCTIRLQHNVRFLYRDSFNNKIPNFQKKKKMFLFYIENSDNSDRDSVKFERDVSGNRFLRIYGVLPPSTNRI